MACVLTLLAVAAVLLVVAAVSLRPEPAAEGVRLPPDTALPADETLTAQPSSPIEPPTSTPTPSPGATRTPTTPAPPGPPTSGARPGESGAADAGVVTARAPLMAFFRGDSLWIAREDGSAQRLVAPIADGVFALSPDGKIIALVRSGVLSMVDVATGRVVSAGPAHGSRPVWTHDSSSVLYVRQPATGTGDLEVWRVSALGAGARRVHVGLSPAVAPDATIACLTPAGGIWVLRQGRAPLQLPVQGSATAVDLSSSQLVYASTALSADGSMRTEIWSMRHDGSGSRRIMSEMTGDRPFAIRELSLCPGQTHLLATVTGDDGYSRTRVVEMATGRATPLAIRRDTYPIGWSADGIGIRLAEGNVFQGEASSLIAVHRDGTGRTLLTEDARIY